MSDAPQKLREIVEEAQFATELKAIEKNARKADEFIDGAKWVLCREPRAGIRIGKTHVFFMPIADSPVVDPVVLFYTYDADHVYLLSIKKTTYPPKENE
jgi:hypothetical protein